MNKSSPFNLLLLGSAAFILVLGCWHVFSHCAGHDDATIRSNKYSNRYICTEEEKSKFPHICHLMDLVAADPQKASKDLYGFAETNGFIIKEELFHDSNTSPLHQIDDNVSEKRNLPQSLSKVDSSTSALPSVLAHGMGDSCFNRGMKKMTSKVSGITGSYATCIPTGDNMHDDTINGYFLNMDESIDIFAAKVMADPELKNGFNAVGFSQGNNLIRGYIARYNDPPVNTFISVNGVNAGVGAVPYCMPKRQLSPLMTSKICNSLMEVASHRAYSNFAQKHSFQANYWRDVRAEEIENYKKFSQLAQLNNEGLVFNSTLNENYAKTNKFVWVMATNDRVVWPPQGEQWGAPNPEDPFDSDILPMKETEWYIRDLFGLKTADENGKNYFESFDGNHLEFNMDDFENWVKKYFLS